MLQSNSERCAAGLVVMESCFAAKFIAVDMVVFLQHSVGPVLLWNVSNISCSQTNQFVGLLAKI